MKNNPVKTAPAFGMKAGAFLCVKLIVEWTVSLRVLQPHLFLDFAKALDSEIDVLFGVSG